MPDLVGVIPLWRLLTGVTHCGVTITDRDGWIHYLNDENRRSLDRRSASPISSRRPIRVDHFCPPAMAAERLAFFRRACDKGKTLVYESIDEGRRDIVTLAPVLGEDGCPVVLSICRPLRSAERILPQDFPGCEIVPARHHFPGRLALLSPRELEVLALVGEGHSYPEIAEILQRSRRTVERHRDNICVKLGVATRLEIAGFAIGAGLADPSPAARDAVLSLAECDPLEFSDAITCLAHANRGLAGWVQELEPEHPADRETEERVGVAAAERLGARRLWELLTGHTGCCVTLTGRDGSVRYANPRSLAWLRWRDRDRATEADGRPLRLGRFVAGDMVEERLGYVRRVCDEGVALAYESINDGLRDLIYFHPVSAPDDGGRLVMSVSRRLRAWERVDHQIAPGAEIVHPQHHEAGVLAQLSPRELEVLILVGEGYAYTEIGQLLHRSRRTVERHRDSICAKLGVTTRLEIARFAIRSGLAAMYPARDDTSPALAGYDPLKVSEEVRAIARRRVRRTDRTRA